MQTELDRILSRLIEAAIQSPGEAFKTRLKGGLVISVRVEADRMLYLAIHRQSVYPSEREWHTVLEHMPWPCSCRAEILGGFTLGGRVPIHSKLL